MLVSATVGGDGFLTTPAGIPSTSQPGTIAGHICGADCCDLRYEPTGRWLHAVFASVIAMV